MKIPNQTRSTRIGGCPSCHETLYANLDMKVEVKLPGVVPQGSSYVEAKAEMTVIGAAINHRCGTRPEFLPEVDTPSEPGGVLASLIA